MFKMQLTQIKHAALILLDFEGRIKKKRKESSLSLNSMKKGKKSEANEKFLFPSFF